MAVRKETAPQFEHKHGKKTNLHVGHRQRVKERYLREGLDTFDDHQVLELMLFFALPQKDTNALAHELLDRYGSLAAVLEADPYDLMKISGVGKGTAVFLSMWPGVTKRYQQSKLSKKPLLDTTAALVDYAHTLFYGCHYEMFYVLCLDMQNRLKYASLVHQGTINEVPVYPRLVVEHAIRNDAKNIVLVHNHTGNNMTPSTQDLNLTWSIVDALSQIDVDVLDHIIIGTGCYLSFAEKGLLLRR